jgi:hypothetical protein
MEIIQRLNDARRKETGHWVVKVALISKNSKEITAKTRFHPLCK